MSMQLRESLTFRGFFLFRKEGLYVQEKYSHTCAMEKF